MEADFYSSALAFAAEQLLERRLVKTIRLATPAAGAELSFTVPGGVVWDPLSLHATFVTSAVAANRNPQLEVRDADNNRLGIIANVTVSIASTTYNFTWTTACTAGYTGSGNRQTLPIHQFPLFAGTALKTLTGSIDVGDQFSAVFLVVREWSETDVVQEMVEVAAQMDSLTQQLVPG